jgi:predicted nucleic acid-binding protein
VTVVLDASVLVELLTLSPLGQRAVERIRGSAGDLHLPHLADIETVSVMRGLVAGGVVTAERAAQVLVDLRDFPARRWPAHMLFERIWMLRANATAYDATYVALAETLNARFVTADRRLAHGVQGIAMCEIELVE